MNIFKSYRLLFLLTAFGFILAFTFLSCQKSEPNPYSIDAANPNTSTTNTTTVSPPDTTPSFLASVNASPIITFTPSKSASGGNMTLKGVSTYYTVTITFPTSSTGPGSYQIGFPSSTIWGFVNNGGTYYYCNYNYGVGGSLVIDSISTRGNYYGKFNFWAEDTVNISNSKQVESGSFYHL